MRGEATGPHSDVATVIAFDPGQTTGWAALGVPSRALGETSIALRDNLINFNYGQIDCFTQEFEGWENTAKKHSGLNLAGENDGVDAMLAKVFQYHKPAIVFEDFILDFSQATSARHTLSPVRITSAFSFGLPYQGGDLSQIHVQSRSLAKSTFTDKRLKNYGLYDKHSGPHARDAVRHAFYFLRECHGNDDKAIAKRHLAWPHLFDEPYPGAAIRPKAKRQPKIGDVIPRLG